MPANYSPPESSDAAESAWAPADDAHPRGRDLGYPEPPGADREPHEEDLNATSPRRDDWWGEPEVETAASEHNEQGTEWGDDERIDDKARHTTFQILRDVAPKLSGASIDDPARVPTELTEPCVYPHGEGNRTHLRQARIDEDGGEISGGESTGVRLGDVGPDTFWNAVELLMGYWVENAKVPFDEDDTESLMDDAKSMRADEKKSDAETIERLAKTALTPDGEEQD
ncbi:hypothetical protein NDI85_19630 [Halomicroarcula sp. S1AR25-4]|uniref:hypothetical protein n=1 Tax=Haloarcula sp. S1AR25-4 TaxID=2950538 RepID=UPI002874E558|nr:hypothetical protein [Halomicroarcula sp. S1AR25-4]MDS0279999.1 hypothetical protein [Halomicroarcula sp. S1AR25-4]